MINKRQIGSKYEELACNYLINKGIKILERNFYCRQGEVDIIAKDKDYLVFVEVKYRKNSQLGLPMEAVTYAKQRNIIRVAKYYLYKKRYADTTKVRFDVVSIEGEKVSLIKDAFWIS